MEKILAAITFNAEARRLQQEKMTRKVEEKLDEYCEFVDICARENCLSLFPENLRNVKDFLAECVSVLANVDYAVFTDTWRTHEDTRLLHVLAEIYGVSILEL